MAHLGISRILAAKGSYPVPGSSRDPGSLYGNVGYLDREGALSAGREVRKKEEFEQRRAPLKTIVVEQWICFMLGFVCMAFGAWGICMRPGQYALSEYIAWLGSFYVPALRLTAVACLGMGVMLIRRGWSHL
jgi:hypothetical protein